MIKSIGLKELTAVLYKNSRYFSKYLQNTTKAIRSIVQQVVEQVLKAQITLQKGSCIPMCKGRFIRYLKLNLIQHRLIEL